MALEQGKTPHISCWCVESQANFAFVDALHVACIIALALMCSDL